MLEADKKIIEFYADKICSVCGDSKPQTEFYKRDNQCKKCVLNKRVEYKKSYPERVKESNKKSRLKRNIADPEYNNRANKRYRYNSDGYRDSQYRYKYGITLNDVRQMFDTQMGLCANRACGKEMVLRGDKSKVAHVDHNHTTGKVRGLLCLACNTALGFLEKKNTMIGLSEYLNKYEG